MKVSKTLLATAALAIAPFAFAQEAQTVSAPATDAPAANSDTTKITIEVPKVKFAEVKDITITPSAMVQVQYAYATNNRNTTGDNSGFAIRRSSLGATAKTTDGWAISVVYQFDSNGKGGDDWSRYIDKALISKKTEYGTLSVGHKKNHFGVEEYSSSALFPCIERSLNSNFLNGKGANGLSGYHCGVEWAGKADSFDYGLSLTNAVAKDYDTKSNDLAVTYYVGKKIKFADKESLYLGFNGIVNFGDDATAANSNAGTVYGFEPYAQYQNGNLNLLGIAYYVDGDGDKSGVKPFYGLNLTATYKLDCGIEPAFRFTYLNTDSGKVNASTQKNVPANPETDNAYTIYAGANYYFNKHVKVAAGYEVGHLYGGAAHDATYGAFRTMLQMKF